MKARLLSLALALALALCLPVPAMAGSTFITFEVTGHGIYATDPIRGVGGPFESTGTLAIKYDPEDPSPHEGDPLHGSGMVLGIDDPNTGILTTSSLSFALTPISLAISGSSILGSISVTLSGTPGPLDGTSGLPLSLAGLGDASGQVVGGYHEPLVAYLFGPVPEPSSWLLLAAGVFGAIGLVSLARAWLPCR